jgi:hypothetical protein
LFNLAPLPDASFLLASVLTVVGILLSLGLPKTLAMRKPSYAPADRELAILPVSAATGRPTAAEGHGRAAFHQSAADRLAALQPDRVSQTLTSRVRQLADELASDGRLPVDSELGVLGLVCDQLLATLRPPRNRAKGVRCIDAFVRCLLRRHE